MLATQLLEIWFAEMLAIIISRNVGNYNFQNYWQVHVPEMLAIIIVRNAGENN